MDDDINFHQCFQTNNFILKYNIILIHTYTFSLIAFLDSAGNPILRSNPVIVFYECIHHLLT